MHDYPLSAVLYVDPEGRMAARIAQGCQLPSPRKDQCLAKTIGYITSQSWSIVVKSATSKTIGSCKQRLVLILDFPCLDAVFKTHFAFVEGVREARMI